MPVVRTARHARPMPGVLLHTRAVAFVKPIRLASHLQRFTHAFVKPSRVSQYVQFSSLHPRRTPHHTCPIHHRMHTHLEHHVQCLSGVVCIEQQHLAACSTMHTGTRIRMGKPIRTEKLKSYVNKRQNQTAAMLRYQLNCTRGADAHRLHICANTRAPTRGQGREAPVQLPHQGGHEAHLSHKHTNTHIRGVVC